MAQVLARAPVIVFLDTGTASPCCAAVDDARSPSASATRKGPLPSLASSGMLRVSDGSSASIPGMSEQWASLELPMELVAITGG